MGWATSTKGPSPAGKVELRDLESGEVRVLESGSHSGDINTYINDACFLRNGQMLLGSFCSLNPGAGRMDRLVCWDIGSAKSVAISCEAGQGPCSVTWIPERSLLVAGHADGTVRVYEDRRKGPQSSQEAFVEIRRFRLHEAAIWSCLFAPAFGGIVTAGSDGYLKVSDPDRGRELQVLHRQGSSINSCALAPDGLLLASASSSGAIRFWLAGREQASSVFFAGTYVNGVAFADDGDLLYFGGGRGLVGVIRVQLNR